MSDNPLHKNGNAIITRGSGGFHIWYVLRDDSMVMLAGAHLKLSDAESACRKMKVNFIVRENIRRTA